METDVELETTLEIKVLKHCRFLLTESHWYDYFSSSAEECVHRRERTFMADVSISL